MINYMTYITYISKLFNQLKTLYTIKTYINNIYTSCDTEELDNSFISLKKIIFESGSLYIKIFQWYISN